jgi:ATP-dependent protease ClpP protease subunit
MTTRLNYINKTIEKIDRYIANKSKMSYEAFMQLHQNELWLDAEDSVKLHLADDVILVQYEKMIPILAPTPEDNKEKGFDIKWKN